MGVCVYINTAKLNIKSAARTKIRLENLEISFICSFWCFIYIIYTCMFNTWLLFHQLCSRKAALLLQNLSGSKVDKYFFTFTHLSHSVIDAYSITPVPLFYTYI